MLHKVLLICHLSPHLSQPQWRIKHTAVRHPEKQALGIDPKLVLLYSVSAACLFQERAGNGKPLLRTFIAKYIWVLYFSNRGLCWVLRV